MAEIPANITGATVADADAYATDRGYADWLALDDATEKPQALTRAWDYLESLDWSDDTFVNGLPDRIKTAHVILGIYEGETPGILKPKVTRANYLKRKSMGKGAISKEYFNNAPSIDRFPMIDRLLSDYIASSGINVKLVRG